MRRFAYQNSRDLVSVGRRLVTIASLLLFLVATIVHFPGADTPGAPLVTVAAGTADAGDDGDAIKLVTDHCDCVVAAPWPSGLGASLHEVVDDVPILATRTLTQRHLGNDGPPPRT